MFLQIFFSRISTFTKNFEKKKINISNYKTIILLLKVRILLIFFLKKKKIESW